MNAPMTLPALLAAFFHDYLVRERNASVHTIRSYRDTWRLFLRFAAERRKRPLARLTLMDLTAEEVLAFLNHMESDRHAGIGTRNCRLAALRSFYAFVSTRDPAALAHCTAVLNIRAKRRAVGPPTHLEYNEVEAILAQPDRASPEGQRDHLLLLFLYNTGARIQEVLDVRPSDLRLDAPPCVRLMGKGRKVRVCPLWPETVQLTRDFLKRCPRGSEDALFQNYCSRPLGASGVRFKLTQYVAAAAKRVPSLAAKKVTPHTFRHTVGVSLVSAGADITVIASYLGHSSLETTNWYARANLATKRAALERVERPRGRHAPRWKRDASVLEWLDRCTPRNNPQQPQDRRRE
jgi:site-specific recombinase XerD